MKENLNSGNSKYSTWLIQQIERYVELRSLNINFSQGESSRLYGPGAFDSMQLVDFIMFIEDAILENHGKHILLADGDAFSQKRSPYLNIRSFACFIEQKADA
jgi:hypothetical protein